MIRKAVTGVCVAVAISAPAAPGGTILFTPDEVTIDPAVEPTVFTLEMSVGPSTYYMLDAIDVIVGSDDLAITGFEWAPFTRFFYDSAPDTSVYQSGWKFGFFGPSAPAEGFLLGTLTVDAATVPPGDYTVIVNSERDGSCLPSPWPSCEPWYGTAIVSVVPEPATVTLLALGALGLARRRTGGCSDPTDRLRRKSEPRQSCGGEAGRVGQDRSLTLAALIGGQRP